MAAIALIGPDGAGKTTLTQMLVESGVLPFKYLYMGIDLPATGVALPTTRLLRRLKRRFDRRDEGGGSSPAHHDAARGVRRRGGPLRAAVRLGNRLAEEWFRQLLSWYYQRHGWTVLYDRHFVFDFSPEMTGGQPASLDNRIHNWLLLHAYPRPDLVIFLDAPGEVLYARKGEWTAPELERRRQAFLQTGERVANFVRVDATKPRAEVFTAITDHVMQFCGSTATAVSPDHQQIDRGPASNRG